ncbi:MAG: thiamine phosphate synthase [Xanthomonadales bacterium]|nr:thiamine phosphate synthase [Xanthomonadales bacterium]
MRPPALAGLYLLTPETADFPALLARLEDLLPRGVALLQYRDKRSAPEERRRRAASLAALCSRHGVPLIVNDDPGLAAEVGAAGVHLGRDDPDPAAARALLGPRAIIGVSCYDDLERGRRAASAGADYLAFGSIFPSATKPGAARAGIGLLEAARRAFALPLCAIGGITPANAAAVRAAGADLLAVISSVFAAASPERALAELLAAIAGAAEPQPASR